MDSLASAHPTIAEILYQSVSLPSDKHPATGKSTERKERSGGGGGGETRGQRRSHAVVFFHVIYEPVP